MLNSAVLPIMSLYQLPNGQYAYSGHVINLPQDVACFANSCLNFPVNLTSLWSGKKELRALQWLLANNQYYRINPDSPALLPDDGNLTGLDSVTLDSTAVDPEPPCAQDMDPYKSHL